MGAIADDGRGSSSFPSKNQKARITESDWRLHARGNLESLKLCENDLQAGPT